MNTPADNMGWQHRQLWRRAAYLLAAFSIYALDQWSKAWAAHRLRFNEGITLINGLLDFSYAENRGIAFSQLQEGGETGRWLLSALALAAATGVLIYFLRTPGKATRVLSATALLLAGILGNLTDRVRLGYVVDFIVIHGGDYYYWPTFNVADASICAGALLLAIDLLLDNSNAPAQQEQQQISDLAVDENVHGGAPAPAGSSKSEIQEH